MKNLLCIVAMLFSIAAMGQIKTPAPSPTSTTTQAVGLTEITVEYSRPSKKGRTIFAADGLVPHGELWRTGANSVTKISFSDDVTVGGKALTAGSYGILTKPGLSSWEVHFHPYDGRNWSSYKTKTPAATVSAEVMPLSGNVEVESFTIHFGNLKDDGCLLEFLWDKTMVGLEIGVNVDERVMKNIDNVLAGPTPGDYYTAASYYYSAGKDLNKALGWVQKATGVAEPRFWQVRREAEILAGLGRYKEAIEVANKSKELARAADNKDYIKINEKNIQKWMKM